MKTALLSAVAALSLLSGCASIVNETISMVRVETYTPEGAEVVDMDCKLEGEFGAMNVRTPATAQVRRSSKDLQITCAKPGLEAAKGVAISRANAGMFGNIIFGGGIGAIIDHNKGTAYTYPQWIRLVVGRMLTFDRSNDKEGAPNTGQAIVVPKP